MHKENEMDRREFLRTGLLVGALTLLPGLQGAALGSLNRQEARLRIYNTHTEERLEVCYRTMHGEYDDAALEQANRVLRCHYTDEVHPINPALLEFAHRIDRRLGGGHEMHVISGYRSRAYNAFLRRQGHGVSPRSLHLRGLALDFFIPEVPLRKLYQTARSLQAGGVGYYPGPGFIHIDVGRVRAW